MALESDVKGLDVVSLQQVGPYALIGCEGILGLDVVSLSSVSPFYGVVPGEAPEPPAAGELSRVYPGLLRVYPGVVRVYPV